MVTRIETQFAGYDCVKLENEALALWLTRSVGPRTTLAPGESASHRETWVIRPDVSIQDLTDLRDPSGLVGDNLP